MAKITGEFLQHLWVGRAMLSSAISREIARQEPDPTIGMLIYAKALDELAAAINAEVEREEEDGVH
jgi:hypothetical protein